MGAPKKRRRGAAQAMRPICDQKGGRTELRQVTPGDSKHIWLNEHRALSLACPDVNPYSWRMTL